MPARTCCWRPAPAASRCSPRCCPIPPRRPAPAATPPPCSASTGSTSKSPARRARSAAPGAPARSKGTSIILARFAKATCQPCPARDRCTTAVRSGRQLGFRHRRIHEAITASRAEQAGDDWQRKYRIRAGVEGTIAQATHVTGIRRARYLGLGKTRLEHNTAAAAINLIRPGAWWAGKPLDRTRTTHLQRLDLARRNPKT